LKRADLSAVEAHVARVEAATGVQVVVALIDKADTYLELPWRAFALGAALGAFATVIVDKLSMSWSTFGTLATAAATLGVGAAFAVAAMLAPPFARLFLRDIRRNAEVRQYAQSLFLRRELFATRARNAVLLLVARFERKVEILPDVGLHDRVTSAEWSRAITKMKPALADERYADAFRDGLEAIEALLIGKGIVRQADAADELPNRPIVERGARE